MNMLITSVETAEADANIDVDSNCDAVTVFHVIETLVSWFENSQNAFVRTYLVNSVARCNLKQEMLKTYQVKNK